MSDNNDLSGGEQTRNREEEAAEIRLLLDQHELDQAAARCSRLLRDYPHDDEAHALMGDLYAARRLWAEAVEWYSLAEQLGAGEQVAERRQAAQARMQGPEETEAPLSYSDLQRQRTRVLAIFIGAGVVMVIALIIALLGLTSRPESAPARTPYPTPEAGGGYPTPTPVSPAGPLPPRATSSRPTPSAPPARTRALGGTAASPGAPAPIPRAPVIITQEMTVPATDRDVIITRAVGSLNWPDGTRMSGDISVMMEPYVGYCMITFRIPESLPGDHLSDLVVQQAYAVAVAAIVADAGVLSMTVRAIATIERANREPTTLTVFRGNTTRKALEYLSKERANPTAEYLRQQLFGTAWWNPAIPEDRLR